MGYPSGQDGAMLPARHWPFCSRNKISPKSKRVRKSFLSQKNFREGKKIFCDFSVGRELENEKTKSATTFAYNWHPFQCSKINKYEDRFSVFLTPYKFFIDQASSVKMAGYWPRSLFALLWNPTSSRSIKTQKENLGNTQPS